MIDPRKRGVYPLLLAAAVSLLLACGGSTNATNPSPELEPDGHLGESPREESGPDPLRVYFIDVGQGDSELIITPGGVAILIDAGPTTGGPRVVETMRRLGVERVNLMVTSHPHADHIGGMEDVLDAFVVMRYADPGYPHTSAMYADLLQRLVSMAVDAYALGMGQWIQLDHGLELRVLAPPDPYLSGGRSDVNSNSIVLLLRYGEVEILFTGDAEADTEQALLRSGLLVDIDVLKVAHHGGGYSSTAGFLAAVRPEIAVISCGEGNSYGHPDPDTLERLEPYTGDAIYRTDLLGTIVLETDGHEVRVWSERDGPFRSTISQAGP